MTPRPVRPGGCRVGLWGVRDTRTRRSHSRAVTGGHWWPEPTQTCTARLWASRWHALGRCSQPITTSRRDSSSRSRRGGRSTSVSSPSVPNRRTTQTPSTRRRTYSRTTWGRSSTAATRSPLGDHRDRRAIRHRSRGPRVRHGRGNARPRDGRTEAHQVVQRRERVRQDRGGLRTDRLLSNHWDMWKRLTGDPTTLYHHTQSFEHLRRLELLEVDD